MVRRWLWLMLAACSGQGSIELVVTAPGLSVTSVELFVGIHDEHLEAIRPQQGALADAVWWKRDRSSTDLRPFDGREVYQLVNGGTLDSLSAFVVVGYDANDTPIAVRSQMIRTDISDDQIDRYEFVLGPAQTPPGSTDRPGVQVWGPPERLATMSTERRAPDPHACVQVDGVAEQLAKYKRPDGGVPKSGLIVSKDDPDCDGLIEQVAPDFECATNEYMGRGQMRRDSLKCGLPTTVNADGTVWPVCTVGGGSCVDGLLPDQSSCLPSAYCMPSAACSSCPGAGCDPYRPQAGTPHIVCDVHAPGAGSTAGGEFCPVPAVLNLGDVLPSLGVTCDPARPAMLRKDRATAWLTHYPIENPMTVVTNAFIDITSTGDCTFDLTPSGPLPRNANSITLAEFNGTLSIPLGPTAEGRGVMIPVSFQVTPPANGDCGGQGPTDCVLNQTYDDRGLELCVAAPIAPGSQVRD